MYNNNRTSIFGYNWWPEEVTFYFISHIFEMVTVSTLNQKMFLLIF